MKNVEVAPQWIPDKEADTCMRCKNVKFNVVSRRVMKIFYFLKNFWTILKKSNQKHHCRNCGYVICGECSKNKYMLPSQSDEPLRVCNFCYSMLSNNTAVYSKSN